MTSSGYFASSEIVTSALLRKLTFIAGVVCPFGADSAEKVLFNWRTTFFRPLVRSARADVKYHIVSHTNDQGPSDRRSGAL